MSDGANQQRDEFAMKLPDVGEGVAEAEIVEWHVSVGDTVTEDDVLVDVMTDKATVELPSPTAGVVRWLAGDVGDIIPVGSTLVRIERATAAIDITEGPGERAGEQAEAVTAQPGVGTPERTSSTDAGHAPDAATGSREPPPAAKSTAAPAVRARARALDIDLSSLTGSGPDGRITHADLDTHLTASSHSAPASSIRSASAIDDDGTDVETIRITGLRRNIAERVQQSKRRIPHFAYVDDVDVTAVEQLRHELNERWGAERRKLSLLPFLMRAVVLAVGDHPEMNARFDDEAGVVHRHRAVHLGIATQTDRGLMVPVVRHAEQRDLWASADEVTRLAEAARSATITLQELSGSTITITSLGALGGLVTTPVINTPEVAIIGVNKIEQRPVYDGDALVRRSMMNLSSSFDHRLIDGVDAATFIQDVRRLLETPALLFVD